MELLQNMENNNKPAADVRAASVARLRRAASLPRMKDGRRPAVTGSDGDGQDLSTGITPSASAATTPFTSTGELPPLGTTEPNETNKGYNGHYFSDTIAHDSAPMASGEKLENVHTGDQQESEQHTANDTESTVVPALVRGRRRRSRSRGSRSGTPKLEIPPNNTTGVISPVQRPSTPATAILSTDAQYVEGSLYAGGGDGQNVQTPEPLTLQTNITTPPSTLNRNRTFITPISPFHQPISPLFPGGQAAYTPIGSSGPPTLAELQSTLTAGGLSRSVSVGRAHALHKLTGGNMTPADSDLFSPFGVATRAQDKSPVTAVKSPVSGIVEARNAANTPPPAGPIARSNTVAGGERIAARAAMLSKIRNRTGPTTPTALNATLESPNGHGLGVDVLDAGHGVTEGTGVAGESLDENMVPGGAEEVLVMPAIVAREKENKKRRRHRRRSSNTAGMGSLTSIASDDAASGDYHDVHGDFHSSDDRRFGSDVNSASGATTPASQFSPHSAAISLPGVNHVQYSNVIRGTPSPRPVAFTPPPLNPLDAIMSSINESSPRIGLHSSLVPDVPGGPRRIEELNDNDIQRQEEMQARYYQGIDLMRAASGGSAGTANYRVLIEEEDEPLPVPVMEPTSPKPDQSTLSPKSAPRPSLDGSDGSRQRPLHDSTTLSLDSTNDGHSSPGFGNLMGRVPIVMHQVGQDGQPTGFGRKGRVKAINENDEQDTLVHADPFPISAVMTPGQDQPIQYSTYVSDADEESSRRGSEQRVLDGGRLAPGPRSWNPKSSDSWIVDSYFRDEDDMGEADDSQAAPSTSAHENADTQQLSPPLAPPKDDWDYVLPQANTYSARASPKPAPVTQPAVPDVAIPSAPLEQPENNGTSSVPSSRMDAPTPSSVVVLTTTEEDAERMSSLTVSDTQDKGSSSSGHAARARQRFGLGIGNRETADSQDSYPLGYATSQAPEVEDEGSTERKGPNERVSGWAKVKQTLTRRRSRSNSFARERGEKGESGISRESGGSLQQQSSAHATHGSISAATTPNAATGLHSSSTAMLSVVSVPRGVSPLPPPSPGDYAKYNDSKLMPFPGIYQLEEQRNYRRTQSSLGDAQATSPNAPLFPNPAALSAPLPPSTRHSPDEGSELNGRGLHRNTSFGNMRQQDKSWPLPQEDYFEPGGSVSRAGSTGSNVKKWLKVLQHGPTSNSASPSPSPYPYPLSYSPAPSAISQAAPNLNRRPSAAEIFLPNGGLQRRPSTPNLLQGLSRKSSLADTNAAGGNAHGLKPATSKSSLKKAFGIFSHDSGTKEATIVEQETPIARTVAPSTYVEPSKVEEPLVNVTAPEPAPVAPPKPPSPPAEAHHPPSPAPLALPPPSSVPIPPPSAVISHEPPLRTGPTPPPMSRIRSPPPIGSRPQSPMSRAQSPSILKKQPDYRAQSPPIRAQSPGFEFINVLSPRSPSPFLVHTPSLTRSKGSYLQKALNSADIISNIDSLLTRNSSGSIADSKSKFMEEPPRKLLLVTPVLQVVSKDSVKDRTLFLFSDILIIAKCMTAGEGGLIMDKSFVVKNIIELKRCAGPICSAGSRDLSNDRRSPLLQSFVSEFRNDQSRAIAKLCDAVGVRRDESVFIADVLFRTHELSRSGLGDYLAKKSNRDILHAFVDKFNFAGVRLDHALRIFLLSILLSDNAEQRSLENLLAGFSARWFHANSSMVAFDKECTKNLVVSIVLLNASLHMSHAHSHPPASPHEFFEAVRAYDQRYSIKDDLLEDIYEAVKQEKISAPKENPDEARLVVTVAGATNPMHFTYRVKSDVVRVRIPAADPNFRVHLLGQGLLFEPPTLHFADSPEATFRVTGTSLGTKSILYWRAGANAHLYNDMPLASDIVIERAFMRNTLKLEVKEPSPGLDRDSLMEDSDQGSTKGRTKKQYVFSIEDSREYDHWAKVLRTSVNRALGIMDPERPPTAQGIYTPVTATFGVPPRIRRAADTVALEVLKETLIGHERASSAANSPPESHIPRNALNSSFGQILSGESDNKFITNGKDRGKQANNNAGLIRPGREIKTLCLQNSFISPLISMLVVQRDSLVDNSQVGSGIGRPQTPKAINVVR